MATIETHFHNEADEEIDKAVDLYTDDIVWEASARRLIFRGKQAVANNYRKMVGSINNVRIEPLYRFGTENRGWMIVLPNSHWPATGLPIYRLRSDPRLRCGWFGFSRCLRPRFHARWYMRCFGRVNDISDRITAALRRSCVSLPHHTSPSSWSLQCAIRGAHIVQYLPPNFY